jgi:hypothetical protein
MTKKYETIKTKVIQGTIRGIQKAVQEQVRQGKKPVVNSDNGK